jgi:hypothetical protein
MQVFCLLSLLILTWCNGVLKSIFQKYMLSGSVNLILFQ